MMTNRMEKCCAKCGRSVNEKDIICPSCGEYVVGSAVTQKTDTENLFSIKASKPKRLKFVIVIGAILLAAILILVAVVHFTGGVGYKRTLHNYFKAHEDKNPELLYKSVVAQYWIDFQNEGIYEGAAMDSLEDRIADNIEDWGCGEKIKISYEITEERRANKEELEALENNIYDWYAYYVYDREEFSITDAYALEVVFTVTGEDRTRELTFSDGILLIKEKGKWKKAEGWIDCKFYSNQ